MPLDLTILGPNGSPSRQVSIGVETHALIARTAQTLNLRLIQRMSDYYADAEYSVVDLPILLQELEQLLALADEQNNIAMREVVSECLDLAREAIRKGVGIFGLAD